MKAKREQIDGELMVIKSFVSNYARDLQFQSSTFIPIFFSSI